MFLLKFIISIGNGEDSVEDATASSALKKIIAVNFYNAGYIIFFPCMCAFHSFEINCDLLIFFCFSLKCFLLKQFLLFKVVTHVTENI